jgi:hypothetical protein
MVVCSQRKPIMKILRVFLLSCSAVWTACWLAGCDADAPRTLAGRHYAWTNAVPGTVPLPGLDQVHVGLAIWGDGAAFVVWSDATKDGRVGATRMRGIPLKPGETRKGGRYKGMFIGHHLVEVECYTPDGKTGKVSFALQPFQSFLSDPLWYDLAPGRLFLVSTEGAEPRVKQLPLAKLNLKPDGTLSQQEMTKEILQRLANTDPEIRAFFGETGERK